MDSSSITKKPHAIFIPFPLQSHITALFKIAKLLHSRGFHISFVYTEPIFQKLLQSRGPDSLKGLPDFRFEAIPDGLPPSHATPKPETLMVSLCMNSLVPVRNLIAKLNDVAASSDNPPVSCLVSDALIAFTLDVAHEFGIPGVLYHNSSAAVLTIDLHSQLFVQNGLVAMKDKNLPSEDLEKPIDFVLGIRDVRPKDLPRYIWERDEAFNFFIHQNLPKILTKASAVLTSTFYALENEVLDEMKSQAPSVYSLGPLQLLEQQVSNTQLDSFSPNLWKEDETCLKWLDSKQPASVIYISFGSVVAITPEQLIELALGLANSGHSFLWIIRLDQVTGESDVLPPGFIERTADRGMISSWCPQEKVLCHPSVGGFLTHNGWNSTLESICSGVPIISWPIAIEQHTISRYSCVHWGIGMRMNDNVTRDEVEGLVREMIVGEKGKGMKKKAMEWKLRAEEAAKPSGSSYPEIDRLIKEVLVQKKLD